MSHQSCSPSLFSTHAFGCRPALASVEAAHLSTGAAADAHPRSFALPGDAPQWSRPRPFAIEALSARVRLDIAARSVDAVCEIVARRVDPDVRELALDAIDFELASVERVEGSAATPRAHRYDGRELRVDAADVPDGGTLTLRIAYRATPRRGLYFVSHRAHLERPDASRRPTQVWSQGQDEDNRHWLPCQDHPNQRMRTEMIATVPRGWFALSNGELVERRVEGDVETFHWRQEVPHPSYLVTLACGEVDEAHDRAGSTPVDYYVPRGLGERIERSLGKTPRMIRFFEDVLRTPFPWAKYAQIVVDDFIFGGMENTSATTLYDRVLLDERAAIDVDMESLVSHELAHQWFGDLVTCRDWSHAWLNEGFATYLEHLWREHEEGRDAYHYGLEQDLEIYLDEERDRYRRPIVTNVWAAPIDLFDRHLYQKGGLTLHALRTHLGDAAFFRGIALYLERMRGRGAETRDLLRAMEDATGRSLEAFFDQWLFRAGHPSLEVSSEHGDGTLRITVVQTQAKPNDASGLFAFDLPIEVVGEGGTEVHRLPIGRQRETFALRCPTAPKMVLVDPELRVVGTVDNKLGTALLAEQLASAQTAHPRWRAARALGRRNEPRAVAALGRALTSDAFWGVRVECAHALGEQRTEDALRHLLGATGDADARVRRAVASALGRFRGSARAADALLAWIERGDRSYLVESELRRSLGRTRDPRALDVLTRAFASDAQSWGEVVRAGAIDGLAALRDARAIPTLLEALDERYFATVRRAGAAALGRSRELTTDEPLLVRVRESLEGVLDAFDPGVRTACARSLASLRDPAGGSALARLADRDLDGRVRRVAREALRDLRDRSARGREVGVLRDELDRVRNDVRELRDKLAQLEAKKGEPSGSAPS